MKEVFGRHGPCDQIALGIVTRGTGEEVISFLRLHALRNDPIAQLTRHIDDVAHQGAAPGTGAHAANEGLVDLDRVGRNILKIREAAVTGAEIIDGAGDARLVDGS